MQIDTDENHLLPTKLLSVGWKLPQRVVRRINWSNFSEKQFGNTYIKSLKYFVFHDPIISGLKTHFKGNDRISSVNSL